ncbi:MAG: hypothetical protein Q8Q42_02130 [Nanoarchaeota archaeon]|nr:hypothetical protein [Nanoarchaeota archaeon]
MTSKVDLSSKNESIDKKAQEELQKKLDQLKSKVEAFKKKVIAKEGKKIVGICILPPERFEEVVNRLKAENLTEEDLRKRIEEEKNKINVLVLIDDQDTKDTKEKIELIKKIEDYMKKTAADIDKHIKSQSMLMSEVREACYDGKYEILKLLSSGVHIHDPKDVLGAIKVSEIHKSMVLQRFEKYIVSYIAVGSLFRGDASSHDIDTAIIIDDTDVKRMSRAELKDKLMSIIRSMGYEASSIAGVKKVFHIQVYILTDFWDGIRDATPVFFTFLRDGIPLYDRGVFMPQKLLLKMGKIKPSPEAIETHMDVGERLIDRAKGKLIGIVAEDLYYAALNPSQSALMLQGYPPSTPRETIRLMEEIFVKKEKLITLSDMKILKDAFKIYKDIEHGELKDITGKEIDSLMAAVSEYVKKIKKIVSTLEKKSLREQTAALLDSINRNLANLMSAENLPTSKNELMGNFSKLVKKGHFTKEEHISLKNTIDELKKASSKEEVEKLRRESSVLRKKLSRHLQRERSREIERARIHIKYGDKYGEVYLLDDYAFMVADLDDKNKIISKSKINRDGSLGKSSGTTIEDLEKHLASADIPKKVFIKELLFGDLKKVFGRDVEILINNQ